MVCINRETGTALKGVAILMILLGHTNYFIWGGAGGVVLFLILSGYGLNVSVREKGLCGYWENRIRKVWLPYVFVGVINVLAGKAHGFKAILCTITGLDLGLITDRTMWYVSFIFVWYIAYYLLVLFTKQFQKMAVSSVIVVAGLLIVAFLVRRLFYNTSLWNYPSGAARYVLGFPIGVILGEVAQIRINKEIKDWFWAILLLLLLAYVIANYGQTFNTQMGLALGVLPILASQLMAPGIFIKRILLWFGRYSYPIYLFEGILLEVRYKWFYMLENPILIDIAFFIASSTIAYIYWNGIYKNVDRLLPARVAKMNG